MKVLTAGGAGSRKKIPTTATTTTTPNKVNAAEDDLNKPPAFAMMKEDPRDGAMTTEKAEHSLDHLGTFGGLEMEHHSADQHLEEHVAVEEIPLHEDENDSGGGGGGRSGIAAPPIPYSDDPEKPSSLHDATKSTSNTTNYRQDLLWLTACFVGIMLSFVGYGLLLEYTTSGGRKLHELSFLFVTSGLYTVTAAIGRYVRDETPSTIPPAQFALLGLTSMGSTFCSVRSLRYVIFPIQVLAKSCKPVPVMLMGAFMGKKYSLRKYVNVVLIVLGVAMFMSGGNQKKKGADGSADGMSSAGQMLGILLLFISLCFDGGTGAYEDKLMSVYSVEPFDLMYQIQLGKTILAGIGLLVFNQLHIFLQMVQDMGFLLVGLGLTGALGQVFIFVTIAKFGALTCSIIGLARKVTTLVASIYFYGHSLNTIQFLGLATSVAAMVFDFWGKKKGGSGGHHGPPRPESASTEETEKMLKPNDGGFGDVELARSKH